jgi:hypothetical protein
MGIVMLNMAQPKQLFYYTSLWFSSAPSAPSAFNLFLFLFN